MTTRSSIKKAYEFFLLEQFIAALGIECEIVEERECPDFIIHLEGEDIGVEITTMVGESHHGMRANESISDRIVNSARKFYCEQLSGPPVQVTACFNPGYSLNKMERDNAAMDLASYIKDLNLSPGQWIRWRVGDLDVALPMEISFVAALGLTGWNHAHWKVARAGVVSSLSRSDLQKIIDKKAKRLPSYRDAVGKNWLVIIADATKPSHLISPSEGFSPHSLGSQFDRSFFYKYPDNQVIELGAGGPRPPNSSF